MISKFAFGITLKFMLDESDRELSLISSPTAKQSQKHFQKHKALSRNHENISSSFTSEMY